jgi:Flp pilus assembly pilin Flp
MSTIREELKHAITDAAPLAAGGSTGKFKNVLRRVRENVLRRVREDVSGEDMIEYALIVGLISLVAVTVLIAAGVDVNGIWTTVNASLTTANASVPAS